MEISETVSEQPEVKQIISKLLDDNRARRLRKLALLIADESVYKFESDYDLLHDPNYEGDDFSFSPEQISGQTFNKIENVISINSDGILQFCPNYLENFRNEYYQIYGHAMEIKDDEELVETIVLPLAMKIKQRKPTPSFRRPFPEDSYRQR